MRTRAATDHALALADRFASGRRVWATRRRKPWRGTRTDAGRTQRDRARGRSAGARLAARRGKNDALDAVLAARGLLDKRRGDGPQGWRSPRSAAAVTDHAAQRRRRPPSRACPNEGGDRHLPRTHSANSCAVCRPHGYSIAAQPPAPGERQRYPEELAARLTLRMLARRAQAATAEANEPRTRDRRARPRPRTSAARRARRRRDRRRATTRCLVIPRPCPLRSRLRTPRRRRAAASFQRTDRPPPPQPRRRSTTQPRSAHDRLAPPHTRPGHQGLHRAADRRRKKPPRSNTAPTPRSPATSPATRISTTHDLTRHRSVIRTFPQASCCSMKRFYLPT